MDFPLQPTQDSTDADGILECFLDYVSARGIDLYPAQEEAILELYSGKNVILATPTGSGKSLVAAALHYVSLATGRRSVYTCPIKALVNEKFLALCRDFGPENVGMMTGDATVNRSAPIICCTAEVLANLALRDGPLAKVDDVIMDEFHYYADTQRGVAWQVPLLCLPQARFLLMSATLGPTHFFEQSLKRLNGRSTQTVAACERPVPLEFSYHEQTLLQALLDLKVADKLPVYIVHFTQRAAAETAQSLLSLTVCNQDEKQAIRRQLQTVQFNSPFGKLIKKLLLSGIGLHHAGLLPKYRLLVENLAQSGLLKLICGTDTLGVGVNVPIRSVLLTQLCKYGGRKTGILSARDFHQISGRAGRKGYDDQGYVLALAPAHVVENKQMEAKAAADPKKKKKWVKRKPPERGFVYWDENTFLRLQTAVPEPLQSSFSLSAGMLLQVLCRSGDGCRAMRNLIRDCHSRPLEKQRMRREAFQLFRALHERKIVELMPPGSDQKLRVNLDLQDDFSLNHVLSLYCLDSLLLLDKEADDYVLKLLSLIEAILEDPDILLRKQLEYCKREKLAELKAAGVEFETRMELLEKIDYPKPEAAFLYESFKCFSAKHPWIEAAKVRPKSIAREMYERYSSFSDYVKHYGLMPAEGLLLRHLTNVYRVLVNTVPPSYKTEPVRECITYLEQVLSVTDSSLLDEWQGLKRGEQATDLQQSSNRVVASDWARDPDELKRRVRNEVFHFVRLLANKAYPRLATVYDLQQLYPSARHRDQALADTMATYYAEHDWIRLDPAARNGAHTHIDESDDRTSWRIEQTLVDPAELNDYQVVFELSLAQVRESGAVNLLPVAIQAL